MEERKTNKKKLVVALALLALIVVASVITTVVLVLAANQQNINSNVTVTYTVTDVSTTVTGKYGLKKTDASPVVDTNMSPSELTINPDDTTNEEGIKMQPAGNIPLNSSQDYVVFEYKFENNATERPFTIDLTYVDDANADPAIDGAVADYNTVVGFTSSTTAITDFDDVCTITPASGATEAQIAWKNSDGANAGQPIWNSTFAQAECQTTTYVYVIVKVINTNAAALFSGAFNFVLVATVIS